MLTLNDSCVFVLIHSIDETTPSGCEWVSSGMENEFCFGTNCELMHGMSLNAILIAISFSYVY